MAEHIAPQLQEAESQPIATGSTADRLIDLAIQASRYVALLAAWIAMSGSLFFSEALGWLPCVLCWYQRILMYPLTVILAVGILRRDERLHLYVLPFSLFGACVSLYHYLLIKTDWLPPPPCVAGIPCTTEYLNIFGFINIPFLALTAFLIISFMMAVWALGSGSERDPNLSEAGTGSADGAPASSLVSKVAVFVIIGTVVAAFVIGARFV